MVARILNFYGVDVNASFSKSGNTGLIIASSRGYQCILENLLNYKKPPVDLNFKNIKGWTALHVAANAGKESLVQLLLNSGAQVNLPNNNEWTALMLAVFKDYEIVCGILIKNGANLEASQKEGWTALHIAIREGNTSITRLLVSAGAKIDSKTSHGDTPLMIAAKFERHDVYELLRTIKIDPM